MATAGAQLNSSEVRIVIDTGTVIGIQIVIGVGVVIEIRVVIEVGVGSCSSCVLRTCTRRMLLLMLPMQL